jgi:hypothetical protein
MPIPCEAGTYQDLEGQASCKTCPIGHFCGYNTSHPVICSLGSYCLAGTKSGRQYLCPNGTYSNQPGLTSKDACTPCDAGMYCGASGLTSPSGPCKEGFFCGGGSATATPSGSSSGSGSSPSTSTAPYHLSYIGDTCLTVKNTTVNGICPPGHYCKSQSVAPTPCPRGTNSTSLGLTAASECNGCISGRYCPNKGTSVI